MVALSDMGEYATSADSEYVVEHLNKELSFLTPAHPSLKPWHDQEADTKLQILYLGCGDLNNLIVDIERICALPPYAFLAVA